MSDEHTIPNVLLGETPQGTLLMTDLATGEQSEHKIIEAETGNFYMSNTLPQSLNDVEWDSKKVFGYDIVMRINGGPAWGGPQIMGTLLMTGDTFSRARKRWSYNPSQVVLGVDDDSGESTLRIVAAKIVGHWHHVVGHGKPIEPQECSSE